MPDSATAWSPLERDALERAVGPRWRVRLLTTAPSTNDLAGSEPPGTVVVADHQTAGRGRLDRTWTTAPGTALTFSMVVEPDLPAARWPLLSLTVALALADVLDQAGVAGVGLKWPNDVLVDGSKVAGILLERAGTTDRPVVVIGIGINVGMRADQLPQPTATSLLLEGAEVGRTDLLGMLVAGVERRIGQLAADPDTVLADYRTGSITVGRSVRVSLPGGEALTGVAGDVDTEGRLVVDGTPVAAGDVVHVRDDPYASDVPS